MSVRGEFVRIVGSFVEFLEGSEAPGAARAADSLASRRHTAPSAIEGTSYRASGSTMARAVSTCSRLSGSRNCASGLCRACALLLTATLAISARSAPCSCR